MNKTIGDMKMNILCFVGIHKWSQGHFMWNPPRYEWCCERCNKKRVHVRKGCKNG